MSYRQLFVIESARTSEGECHEFFIFMIFLMDLLLFSPLLFTLPSRFCLIKCTFPFKNTQVSSFIYLIFFPLYFIKKIPNLDYKSFASFVYFLNDNLSSFVTKNNQLYSNSARHLKECLIFHLWKFSNNMLLRLYKRSALVFFLENFIIHCLIPASK